MVSKSRVQRPSQFHVSILYWHLVVVCRDDIDAELFDSKRVVSLESSEGELAVGY